MVLFFGLVFSVASLEIFLPTPLPTPATKGSFIACKNAGTSKVNCAQNRMLYKLKD